jgi:hypothetical protein
VVAGDEVEEGVYVDKATRARRQREAELTTVTMDDFKKQIMEVLPQEPLVCQPRLGDVSPVRLINVAGGEGGLRAGAQVTRRVPAAQRGHGRRVHAPAEGQERAGRCGRPRLWLSLPRKSE